jgi:hypothetical protein
VSTEQSPSVALSEPPDVRSLVDTFQAFRTAIDRRNRREWIACAFVAAAFSFIATRKNSALSAASALEIVAASGYVAWRLHRDGRVRLSTSAADDPLFAQRYADELLRHANLLRAVPWWYLLPLGLGLAGLQLATFLELRSPRSALSGIAFLALVFGVISWANRNASRELRARAALVAAGRGDPGPRRTRR